MPSTKDYLNLVYVSFGFLTLFAIVIYKTMAINIERNWSKYRCNPFYWIFSKNLTKDLEICSTFGKGGTKMF
jgi:hypothetical protein